MMWLPPLVLNGEYQDLSGVYPVNHAVGEPMHEEPTNSRVDLGSNVRVFGKPLQRRLHLGC